VIIDPHPDLDQHHNLTISRRSLLAHTKQVWSTSVNAFVSNPAHRQNDRQTDRQTDKQYRLHNSALAEKISLIPVSRFVT